MPTLHWIGKEKVVNHHAEVPFRVLEKKYHFSAENGENFEGNSENKIIHGDNLEALKSLLPQYEGKIKCIYIDPPYNTGNEGWVYNDNFNHPKIKKWLGETVGKEGEDLSRHDKWLCMMYPRLKLLHKLLAEDGVIFVSIDDNEQAHLKLMMDEIFGGGNFITNFIWRRSGAGGLRGIFPIDIHEYVFCYTKNKNSQEKQWKAPYSTSSFEAFNCEDEKGKYKTQALYLTSLKQTDSQSYPIQLPCRIMAIPPKGVGSWRFIKEKFQEELLTQVMQRRGKE